MSRRRAGLSFRRQRRKFNLPLFKEIVSWVVELIVVIGLAYVLVSFFGIRTNVVGQAMEQSGTVVSKKRGSGILAYPDMLDSFLDELYTKADFPVSIKTRVGFNDDELWPRLIEIYSKYPISELTVHPRVQKDFYKNTPRMDDFALAMQKINPDKTTLCYNGDITDTNSFNALTDCFPDIDEIMIGRGLFANPALIAELKGISMDKAELRERLKNWHDEILSGYLSIFSGEKDAIFRMKEIWAYMHGLFSDSEKLWKKIKKCQTLNDYKSIVRMAFDAF